MALYIDFLGLRPCMTCMEDAHSSKLVAGKLYMNEIRLVGKLIRMKMFNESANVTYHRRAHITERRGSGGSGSSSIYKSIECMKSMNFEAKKNIYYYLLGHFSLL